MDRLSNVEGRAQYAGANDGDRAGANGAAFGHRRTVSPNFGYSIVQALRKARPGLFAYDGSRIDY